MQENLKNHIKKLLAEGEIQRAISTLLAWSKENYIELHDKIILLSGRYNNLKDKQLLSLESQESLERGFSKINFALIEFLNGIPDQDLADTGSIVIEEAKPKSLDKNSFTYWFQNKTKVGTLFAFMGIVGLLLGISVLALSIFEFDRLNSEEDNFRAIAFIAVIGNIFVAFLAVKYNYSAKINEELEARFASLLNDGNSTPFDEYFERAKTALKEFIWFWQMVWVGWIVLYFSFLLKFFQEELHFFGISEFLGQSIFTASNEFLFQIWIDTWTNVSSFGLVVCFSILYFKNITRKNRHFENPITMYSLYIFLAILITQIIIYLSIDTNETVSQTVQGLFKILVGLGSAISISLLAGRLDSKLINASISFIIITYFYAGIQSLISFFEPTFFQEEYSGLSHFARAFGLNYALFAKCVLFLFILWLINEGKLLLYIIRLNAIVDENKIKD